MPATTSAKVDILQALEKKGALTTAEYMSIANQHYYATRDPLAKDFITAPEISQLFGEMISAWIAELWEAQLYTKPLVLVELGPGRGTLIADILRVLENISHQLTHSLDVKSIPIYLVENSPTLSGIQKEKLSNFNILSVKSIPKLEGSSVIILNNEFFDALPVEQWTVQTAGLQQKIIAKNGKNNDGLQIDIQNVSRETFMRRQAYFSHYNLANAKVGDIIEFHPDYADWMQQIGTLLKQNQGAMLAIDYGYTTFELGDTWQALHNHKYVDVLDKIGDADLTSHVNFAWLMELAEEQGLDVYSPLTQRQFLRQMGIELRLAQLCHAHPDEAADLEAGVKRLIDPAQMGHLFKVFCTSANIEPPAGFFHAHPV